MYIHYEGNTDSISVRTKGSSTVFVLGQLSGKIQVNLFTTGQFSFGHRSNIFHLVASIVLPRTLIICDSLC